MQDSAFRVEKRRAEAELTLSTGSRVHGHFFLSGASATHAGPERVGDLLNGQTGFFPFELAGDGEPHIVLYNRAHVVTVTLPPSATEPRLDPGYDVVTKRTASILLSNGDRVSGTVCVYRPVGRDRLSDYARIDQAFRYVETGEQTVIVNATHIVQIEETSS